MDNLCDKIQEYLKSKNITLDEFAKDVKIDKSKLEKMLVDKYTPDEIERESINKKITSPKMSKSKIIVKSIELILKFTACIMALVTLLLCIMGNVEVETLVSLLSIGVVCATIPSLPKIEK